MLKLFDASKQVFLVLFLYMYTICIQYMNNRRNRKLACGGVGERSSFLADAIQVPHYHALLQDVPDEEKFTPKNLVDQLKEAEHGLGLVIDLTFTTRYYDKKEMEKMGVQYKKIPVEGQVVPRKAIMEEFNAAVKEFIEEHKDDEKLIGVHCTHGLNRTGYVICKHLISEQGVDPDTAIEAFNEARGHSIERNNYLVHLRTGELPVDEKESYFSKTPRPINYIKKKDNYKEPSRRWGTAHQSYRDQKPYTRAPQKSYNYPSDEWQSDRNQSHNEYQSANNYPHSQLRGNDHYYNESHHHHHQQQHHHHQHHQQQQQQHHQQWYHQQRRHQQRHGNYRQSHSRGSHFASHYPYSNDYSQPSHSQQYNSDRVRHNRHGNRPDGYHSQSKRSHDRPQYEHKNPSRSHEYGQANRS